MAFILGEGCGYVCEQLDAAEGGCRVTCSNIKTSGAFPVAEAMLQLSFIDVSIEWLQVWQNSFEDLCDRDIEIVVGK